MNKTEVTKEQRIIFRLETEVQKKSQDLANAYEQLKLLVEENSDLKKRLRTTTVALHDAAIQLMGADNV